MTTQVYQRLETAKDGASATLNNGDTLMGLFNRRLSQRLAKRLWAACDGCEPSYCAAASAAFVAEGDGVFVEPKNCPACGGWRLVPSAGEVSHG
jgi:hypothetical protein